MTAQQQSRSARAAGLSPAALLGLLAEEIALSQSMLRDLEAALIPVITAQPRDPQTGQRLQALDRLSQRLGDLAALAREAAKQAADGPVHDLTKLVATLKLEEITNALTTASTRPQAAQP